MRIFPAREGKREKKRATVELCQLHAHWDLRDMGHDLSDVHLLLGSALWQGNGSPRRRECTELQDCRKLKGLSPLSLWSDSQIGNLIKSPISWHE